MPHTKSMRLALLALLFTPPLFGQGSEQAQLAEAFGRLPLYFIANQGQVDDERVFYYVKGADKTLYFTPGGITLALKPTSPEHGAGTPTGWAVKLDFLGADPDVRPQGENRQGAVFSYFKGEAENWKTDIPTYGRVVYRNLWPGIDLIYSGTESALKYKFVVQPRADPNQIRMSYRGVSNLKVTESGALEVSTPGGSFQDGVPIAWQNIEGERQKVAMRFAVGMKSESERIPYGFDIGAYDPEHPLILDPVILVYCGYIGGNGDDYGRGIAVDSLGNAYVTGHTVSTESTFPVKAGPDLTFNSGWDAFVARVNAQGTALHYCGYIGGSLSDWGRAIAVDGQGSAYVAGSTFSDESTFPVIVGPDLTLNGSSDVFVARVNASGTGLDYCGYIGGSLGDNVYGVAVDDQGNAYVTGNTSSDQSTFPVTVGPDLSFNGSLDAFVARVNALGTALDYCGYLGGSSGEIGYDVAVDSQGNAYVVGETVSDESSFPVVVGPDLTFNGDIDTFVAKVNAQGSGLDYCGYLGGTSREQGFGIAVDGQGNAYVTGQTSSDEISFPVTMGPDLTFNGGWDAFVARVNATGSALDYCGYIGGTPSDYGQGIAVDGQGNAYVAGETDSDQSTFPVVLGPDLTFNGTQDAFVARVNPLGSALDYCGYIGGDDFDRIRAIAVDGQGNAYVTGDTWSDESSFPVTVGPDLTHNNGIVDAFAAKIEAFQFTLAASPDPLVAGQLASVSVTGATPSASTWLAYSLIGFGSTAVPQLGITLDLANPFLASGPDTTNAQGEVNWSLLIPPAGSGLTVWLQAAQVDKVSNVVATSIL